MIINFDNVFHASERETLAIQAEEIRVAVARGFHSGEKLVCDVGAAAQVAFGAVPAGLRRRHPGARCFLCFQRCSVAAKHLDWRPIGKYWNRRRRMGSEFSGRMDDYSTHDRPSL